MTATDDLRAAAESWLADDPDPATRDELRAAIAAALAGDGADLADRFAGPLRFGTAGLRGPLRAGPNGMNRAVVRQAAAGLVSWLAAGAYEGPLVIGFDARHGSRGFAEETARVATGAGRAALVLPRPLPTPVLAHAVRALGAAAGVMVTASHNPPQDNGYKVYLSDGAQLVPPADAEIEAAIRAVGPLREVPLGEPGEVLPESIVESYVDAAVARAAPGGPRGLSVAYTPLHGVGAAVLTEVLSRAGFPAPVAVPEQAEPDPDFPTVAFPNPEEPGAMDRVIALATATGADLAIANDPDADRCAVAVPVPASPGLRSAGSAATGATTEGGASSGTGARASGASASGTLPGGGWRMLRGDEVGVLLADHLMRRGVTGRYATTIVSSSLLRTLCAARGQEYGETLTGFKWIVRAGPGLVYGYEEALGYCVAPELVRDKDGITATLLVCELAAGLKASGQTLLDRLDDLAREFGVYATDQLSVRVTRLTEITRAMTHIRRHPPAALLDEPISETDDLLPDADVLTLRTPSARVVVRPSGTEPKLKAYLEVIEPVLADDVAAARERAHAGLAALRAEVATALGL